MDRHPFDPISLVFGVVFTIAGILLLSGAEVSDEGRFLLPLGLIGLGIAVLVQARSRTQTDDEE